MKTVVSFLAVVFSASFAVAQGKTLENYPELSSFIEDMSSVASEGASLEHFGYWEINKVPRTVDSCKTVSKEEVVRSFEETVEAVEQGGGFSTVDASKFAASKPLALAQFKELIGKGPFLYCREAKAEQMSYSVKESYLSDDYSFGLELGFED